jgi:hypothetical protein
MLYKGSSLQVGFMKSRYWPGLVVHRFGLVIFGAKKLLLKTSYAKMQNKTEKH